MRDVFEIWEEIKSKLKLEVEESVYEDYFAGITKIYKEQNNNIYLIVENAFYKKRIQSQYLDRMNALLSEYYEIPHRFYLITKDEVVKEEENKSAALKIDDFKNLGGYGLNPNFTFSNFIVGSSNSVAFSYAMRVANNPQGALNPIYIFGGVGLGKTHLMQAIGNYIVEHNPSSKVLYIGTQDFVLEYSKATQMRSFDEFSKKFEGIDALLVDDIQFLEVKTGCQLEFFKIFERLMHENKLIVITSDRPAKDLVNIMARLTSRFSGGQLLDITKPEKDLRVQILKSKVAQELPNPEVIPDDVLEYIATVCDNNVRQLEGCLNRVIFNCAALELEYTVENARESLKNIVDFSNTAGSATASNEEIKKLLSVISTYFRITETELLSNTRKKPVVYARQFCWYLLKTKYDLTYQKIGSLFGGKDHSTVMHGCTQMEEYVKSDPMTKKNVENVLRKMGKDPNAIQ